MTTASSSVPKTLKQRARRLALRWALFLGIVYLGCVFVMWSLENKLVYRPTSVTESWEEPEGLNPKNVWLTSPDGTRTHAWWFPPERPENGAVLVAHGNGGNLSFRADLALQLRQTLGAGVLLFDYPGYGQSEGKPSEQGCYDAADSAYRWLTGEAGIAGERIVIFGESLGGGVAVHTATNHTCRALVLVFTFTTLPDAAKTHYRWLPVRWLMRNRFDNLAKIGQVKCPVFIAHGTADEIVPFRQGETLFAAANEPKEFWRVEGAHHDLAMLEGIDAKIERFLQRTAP